ncbi:hypothetical protein ACFL3C_04365 [Patescibacteria group bacterium]
MANHKARGKIGNRGGGRKSAYEEHRSAKILHKAFFDGVDIKELETACNKKKVKFINVLLHKALTNDRILMDLFKRIHPEHMIIEDQMIEPIDLSEESKKRLAKYED